MYDFITVNAGHSASAVGASGCGYKEHEVARKIKDLLIHGFQSVGQKTADTTSDALTKGAVLKEQTDKCNSYHYLKQLDVSIHLNAGGGTGVEVLYLTQETLSSTMSAAIAKTLGINNRGAKQRKDLYFLNQTNKPAILIEVCFIDNVNDMKKLFANLEELIVTIVKELTGKKIQGSQNYTIRSGETLSKIAQRFQVTVNDILTLNPQITNKNLISIGQVIKIPNK
jgi:N-acetylmuramoyl-L-alanine amidase